jgi:putative transposase
VKILRAYKTELDPNDKQRTFFRQCTGAARYVYNWALADRSDRRSRGIKTSQYEQRTRFNALKAELCPWIYELPYAVIEKAFADLDSGFKHYWRQKKDGTVRTRIEKQERKGTRRKIVAKLLARGRSGIELDPGYPNYKSKSDLTQSFSLCHTKIERDRVRLTGIGWIRLKERGYIPTEGEYGVYATISEKAGRWFVSVLVEEEMVEPAQGNGVLGVDLGIKALAVCSDGTVFENPKALYAAERKQKRIQREVSRRVSGSQNRCKSVRKLQRCHARVANIRRHALHQVSHYVTVRAKPHVVVIEDLNVLGMEQNHHLARAVGDAGMGELRRQIEYKAAWYGVKVMVADRWYPSSKTCSECGATNKVLTLSDRTFVCPACGCIIERDLNAARNLASLAA